VTNVAQTGANHPSRQPWRCHDDGAGLRPLLGRTAALSMGPRGAPSEDESAVNVGPCREDHKRADVVKRFVSGRSPR
jgi:hypothetical protein